MSQLGSRGRVEGAIEATDSDPGEEMASEVEDDVAEGVEEEVGGGGIGALEHSEAGGNGDNETAASGAKRDANVALEMLSERNSESEQAMISLNARLFELARQIKKSQPKRHGAVLLQLNNCGRGCIGCPHPRWQRWVNRNVENRLKATSWFAVSLKSPLAATRKLEYSEETRDLIREAIEEIKKKTALVRALNTVNQVVRQRKLLP